jgi:hypothetical protein
MDAGTFERRLRFDYHFYFSDCPHRPTPPFERQDSCILFSLHPFINHHGDFSMKSAIERSR